MNKEIQLLINNFERIAKKRWILSVKKGLGSVGLTFEKELDKKADSIFFPDYYGIEIKCTTRFSKFPISLFSLAFDGPSFPEIYRIVEKYGYFDSIYKDKKILYTKLSCVEKNLVSGKYMFQLEVDERTEKIYLCVYDFYNQLIEKESFIYLKSIFDRLTLKVSKLAIIYASKKVIEGEESFRYYKIVIYKLRSHEIFLEMLKSGKIEVYLEARLSRSGISAGSYKNKNLIFKISKELIDELFEIIYYDNYDERTSFNQFFVFPDTYFEE